MAKNYNYVFVFYDVEEKRVNKVFKVCKKYLTHYQNSVFRGEITPSNIMKLEREIAKITKKDKDFVSFIKLYGSFSFEEKIIGTPNKGNEALFI